MSIIEKARAEILSSLSNEFCCIEAFLYGVIRGIGFINIRFNQWGIGLESSDEQLINKCTSIISSLSLQPISSVVKEITFAKKNQKVFEVLMEEQTSKIILEKLGFSGLEPPKFEEGLPAELFTKECCKKSLIKGVFLSTGTLSTPKTKEVDKTKSSNGYYLEMKVYSEKLAQDISNLLLSFGINSKIRKRNISYSVYIKDAEMISDFLAATSASNTLFQLQDLILFREASNNSNRGRNCNLANINKVVGASVKQIKAIENILDNIGLDEIDENLRELAIARLEYPELSLSELGVHLGNVSKSCISHRMRKLISLSEENIK